MERKYIMKTFDKTKLMALGQAKVDQILAERDILKLLDSCDGIVSLATTTKEGNNLCLVLELACGFDLITLMRSFPDHKLPLVLV
jgi:hypothetical protein